MPQEDKIKREIDRIGLVLAKLLSMLINKSNPNEKALIAVMEQTQSELDIDLPALLEMDKNAAMQYLVKDKGFSNDHLRLFANMLYETAKVSTDEQQAILRTRALDVYEYIDTNANGTVYLDVAYRLKELRHL